MTNKHRNPSRPMAVTPVTCITHAIAVALVTTSTRRHRGVAISCSVSSSSSSSSSSKKNIYKERYPAQIPTQPKALHRKAPTLFLGGVTAVTAVTKMAVPLCMRCDADCDLEGHFRVYANAETAFLYIVRRKKSYASDPCRMPTATCP
jgi:hypothetical protein